MRLEGLDTDAYLIRIRRDTQGVTISDLTLHGPAMHGAVFAWFHTGLHLHHLRIKDTLWCGLRTFGMKNAKIHDCEFVRNGVEIDHNLFDFDVQKDHGNLISAFGNAAAPGPASFHNNLVSNPGRGVMWMNEPYGKLEVRNNHIIARTTKEPRTDGLFGFNEKSGFAEFRFADNIIESEGTPRPLFRNDASGGARVENNQLVNIADTARYRNQATGKPQGPEQPLKFECGVAGELTVDGWKTRKTVAR
jgi:nitrous oxidase accessory protein